MKRSLVAAGLLSTLLACLLTAQTDGDRLIEAAQKGDIELAKALLSQGADVNARTRYGATALFFACDKGNVELTKLLLENGADVNVVDTFYGATPITWLVFSVEESEPHREILGLLLAEKPDDAAAALPIAAELGDETIARAVVASRKADARALMSAIEIARGAGHESLATYLEQQLPEGSDELRIQIPIERLQGYVGAYENAETGSVFRVYLEGGTLMTQGPGGQPPLTLDPESPEKFVLREAPGIAVIFRGGGGGVEQMVVLQPESETVLVRKDADAETVPEDAEAPAMQPVADLPNAERSEARPWPAFRGTDRAGIGDGQGAPTEWDAPSGKNILWKTPIPGLANSSPIIWGDRIFVTTASTEEGDDTLRIGLYGDVDSVEDSAEHTWLVYALDKRSGEILWKRVAAEGTPKLRRHLKSTHANPTPVTDGRHVVVSFGSEGVYCYDFEGRLLWRKDLGLLESGWFYDPTYEWGFGSSPILHNGRVILQIDIQKGSSIMALDVATGRELWRTERDEIPTWGTPVVLSSEEPEGVEEIVTNGTTIRGYDASTGELLWWLRPNSEITVASPIVGQDLAYITGGYTPVRPVYAVRAGSRGDLSLPAGETSSEAVAWSLDKGGAYMPTPLLYEGILYVFHGNGRLAAYEAESGESIYKERVGSGRSFSGSPVAADGRLFFTSEQGETFVVRSGREFEILAHNTVDEFVMSTPAISDGLIAIRGKSHVYGIGIGPSKVPSKVPPE